MLDCDGSSGSLNEKTSVEPLLMAAATLVAQSLVKSGLLPQSMGTYWKPPVRPSDEEPQLYAQVTSWYDSNGLQSAASLYETPRLPVPGDAVFVGCDDDVVVGVYVGVVLVGASVDV